jgi:hypothetical protein
MCVIRFLVRSQRGTDAPTKRTPDDRTVPATDFVPDSSAGRATDAPTDCRIKGGIIGIRLDGQQQNGQNRIFDIHMRYSPDQGLQVTL